MPVLCTTLDSHLQADFIELLDDIQHALEQRHGLVHGLWPGPTLEHAKGWRHVRKNKRTEPRNPRRLGRDKPGGNDQARANYGPTVQTLRSSCGAGRRFQPQPGRHGDSDRSGRLVVLGGRCMPQPFVSADWSGPTGTAWPHRGISCRAASATARREPPRRTNPSGRGHRWRISFGAPAPH